MSNDHKIDEQYAAESWDKMSVLLDREMPEEKKRKRALFFLLPLLGLVFLGLGILYVLDSNSGVQEEIAKTKKLPLIAEAKAQETKEEHTNATEDLAQIAEVSIPDEHITVASQIEVQQTKATQIKTKTKVQTQAQTTTRSNANKSKSIAFVETVKPQKVKETITELDDNAAQEVTIQNPITPLTNLVAPVEGNIVDEQITTRSDLSTEIKILAHKNKALAHTLDAPLTPSKETVVFNEKIILEKIASISPPALFSELPVKNLSPIKGVLCGPGNSYAKNSLYLFASGIYGFHNDFAGAQLGLRYDHAIYKNWLLSSGLGYTSWFTRVSFLDDDAMIPSGQLENAFSSVIRSTSFNDVNASMGLAYQRKNWKIGSGIRYRRYFNVSYDYPLDPSMDGAGLGINDDEYKEQIDNRISNDRNDQWSAYLGLKYQLNNKLGIGIETEFAKRQVDINRVEQRPIYLSGTLSYRF